MVLGVDSRVRLPTGELIAPVANSQMSKMMIVFSIGYVAVFAVFTLLYWRAHTKRAELKLNPLEVLDTRTELEENLLHMGVGLLSIGLASFNTRGFVALAGYCYALIGPVMTVHGRWMGKKRKRLEASLLANEVNPELATGQTEETTTNASQIADVKSPI
jgi:hypothetical protein